MREFVEETGLQPTSHGRLAWVNQTNLDDPDRGGTWTAFVFEVPDCGGEPACDDPDGLVHLAEFMPVERAIGLLAADPGPITDPAVAFLQGRAGHGSYWALKAGPRFSTWELLHVDLVDP